MKKAVIKTTIITLLLIPLLASCKIGKKYTRPELNLPSRMSSGRHSTPTPCCKT